MKYKKILYRDLTDRKVRKLHKKGYRMKWMQWSNCGLLQFVFARPHQEAGR